MRPADSIFIYDVTFALAELVPFRWHSLSKPTGKSGTVFWLGSR